MFTTLIEGFFLGLATGSTCLVTCTPIYLPYLLTEERNFSKSLLTILEISAGRFFSYLTFGALAGFAGTQIATINRSLFTSIAYILLSIYLVLSAVRTHKKAKKCHIPKATMFTKSAFILGILTGINFCPSFLIALSKAVDLGGVFDGINLFLGFFFGTTLFLIPIAFAGGLSKIKEMGGVAKIASILIAVWFTFIGVKGLVKYFNPAPLPTDGRMVEVFVPTQELTIIASEKNIEYFSKLKAEINKMHNGQVLLITEANIDSLSSPVLLIDKAITDKDHDKFKEYDFFAIENNYPLEKMLTFMNSYVFRTSDHLHWDFSFSENKHISLQKP